MALPFEFVEMLCEATTPFGKKVELGWKARKLLERSSRGLFDPLLPWQML